RDRRWLGFLHRSPATNWKNPLSVPNILLRNLIPFLRCRETLFHNVWSSGVIRKARCSSRQSSIVLPPEVQSRKRNARRNVDCGRFDGGSSNAERFECRRKNVGEVS